MEAVSSASQCSLYSSSSNSAPLLCDTAFCDEASSSDYASDASSPTSCQPTPPIPPRVIRTYMESTEIWFSEGTVMLASRERGLFRVHRDILSLHSDFFKTLFALPQPKDDPEMEYYEGCPVLHMDDTPTDLFCLLKAVYHPRFLRDGRIPFYASLSALHLATKYDFLDIRTLAISRLLEVYPSSLARFDVLLDDNFTKDSGAQMQAIRIALQCDVPSILPVALYRLAALSPRKTQVIGKTLPRPLRQLFERGLRGLIADQRRFSFKFIHDAPSVLSEDDDGTASGCRTRELCLRIAEDTNRPWLTKGYFDCCMALHHFVAWDENAQQPDHRLTVCTYCRALLQESHEEGRRALWASLPGYFGLGSWERIKVPLE